MMRFTARTLSLALLVLAATSLSAQKKAESEAATIKFSLDGQAPLKVGDKTRLLIEVTPKKGWHVYSALPSEEGAYQPAAVGWEIQSRGFEAAEKLEESGAMTSMFDEIMNGTVRYYKGQVTFSQELKLTEVQVTLVGYFDYMACNDEKCIPLTADLNLEATAKK